MINNPRFERTVYTAGVNWFIAPTVVFKAIHAWRTLGSGERGEHLRRAASASTSKRSSLPSLPTKTPDMRYTHLLPLALSALAFVACEDTEVADKGSSERLSQVLENTGQNVIVRTYEELASATKLLRQRTDALRQNPTQDRLEAAREAWVAARSPWGAVGRLPLRSRRPGGPRPQHRLVARQRHRPQ